MSDKIARAARKFPDTSEAFARFADAVVMAEHSAGLLAATLEQVLKNLQLERALTPRWRILRRWRLSHEIRALGGDNAGVKS